ncbi:MAG: sigma-70 family RNA polymerase sigma factor [Myxococcota bacterium]|nr:sigma-70 family RNA polymerase sigma factor [Myxococcota bacterium]
MNNPTAELSINENQGALEARGDLDDLALVQRCQAGDEAAFAKLVTRYQRKVFTVALGMVKNPEDAMDVAQDAFIKVHRHIAHFQGTSSFYTWLYRIVVNLCIDHLRRGGRHVRLEFDEKIGQIEGSPDAGAVLSSDLNTNPSRCLGRKELAAHIFDAVQQLPPYHRAVILMREVEGMSYSDMAKAMKVSKGTIMSRLHHARQKLQRMLGDYLEGELTVR